VREEKPVQNQAKTAAEKIEALATARQQQLLDQRTRMLARRPQDVEAAGAPILMCEAGGTLYGLAMGDIAEVLPFRPCAPLSGANPAMLGLFVHGGRMISALDLGGALNAPRVEGAAADGHLLLVRGFTPSVALRVDRVIGTADIRRVASGDIADGGGDRDAIVAYGQSIADPSLPLAGLIDLGRLLRPFLSSSTLGA
jgi:purine-binding chemotaxis protein CheW